MRPEWNTMMLAAVSGLMALVAGIAAAIDGSWSVAAAAFLAAATVAALIDRLRRQRVAVRVRPDLVRWLEHRSAVTGEPRDVLADRAIAHHRDQLGDRARDDG